MSVLRSCAATGLAVALLVSLAPDRAEAQLLRSRARNLIMNAAGVGAQLGRIGVAPYGYGPGGYGYGPAPRLIVVSPQGLRTIFEASPYGPLALPRTAARPYLPQAYDDQAALPTEGELRAMDDSSLLNSLLGLAARLDADLNQFTTASTWQSYLRLPDDALPPPQDNRVELGLAPITETLNRFESTVANPEYVQISGLPSFAAMHAALKETVRRYATAEQPIAGQVSPGGSIGTQQAAATVEQATIEQAAVATEQPQTFAPTTVPAVPRPDSPLARTDRPQLQTPSIERQSLQTSRAAASEPQSSAGAEELPNPPPSLVAPQNASAEEHSILSR